MLCKNYSAKPGRRIFMDFRGPQALSDTHGKKRPCVRHPDYLYTYFVDTRLATLQRGAPKTIVADTPRDT
jgi:hypothetical protein